MKQSQPFFTRPGQLVLLDAMLERLEPALKGYPVRALIDLWAGFREGEAPLATTLARARQAVGGRAATGAAHFLST